MRSAKSPPTPLLELASDVLEAPLRWREVSRDHAASAVWEVKGSGGTVVLKAHAEPRKYAQEVHAYRTWAAHLGDGVPRLLAARNEAPRGLLLEHLPGDPVGDGASDAGVGADARDFPAPIRERREWELHRRAGAWLAAWHALPLRDADDVSLADAYLARAEAWTERARRYLPRRVLDAVQDGVAEAGPVLAAAERVPCHRDFTPRNWLARRGEWVGVIDFEHARGDLGLVDVLRLWCDLWPHRPDLREAFEEGYGRPFEDEDETLLRPLAELEAVATLAWAEDHFDRAFARQSRATLHRLRGDGAH